MNTARYKKSTGCPCLLVSLRQNRAVNRHVRSAVSGQRSALQSNPRQVGKVLLRAYRGKVRTENMIFVVEFL